MLTDGPGTNNASRDRLALLVIFFLSGASGLIYQVVWSRSLVLVFGSTTHAVSTVLAAFMCGLALGSLLVGRRGDRLANPLKAYAIIEVAIAILALAVIGLLPAMVPIYRAAWELAGASPATLNLLRFILACLILLPPTTLMGATLPILSAHAERGARPGSGSGSLYAANTVGAVAGTVLAGFVLLPAAGMMRSAIVAALANLIAAAAAMRLARTSGKLPARAQTEVAAAEPFDARLRVLMIAFAASGAGALVFEVVWTRILSLVLGSSTQAFTIMLSTFLAGLALGSAVATRFLPRIPNPLLCFCIIELGAGLTALLGIYLFPELPYSFLVLFRSVGGTSPLFQTGRFLIAALVMLPPTFLLGAAFPLAARAVLAGRSAVSAPVAALYSANTFGAILGSCAAGFLLIPAIGLQGALIAGCVTNFAAGALLLAFNPTGSRGLRFGLAAAVLVCLPGLAVGMPEWNSPLMTSGVFQYAPRYLRQFGSRREFLDYHRAQAQLYYKDGPTTTVAVERRAERIDGQVNMVLSVNGKVDASSVGDMESQVLVGQIPMLFAPRRDSVLVIGMGSGVSAGSALTHPLGKLDLVEIEPAIIEASSHFDEINGRPLADPRTTLRINDARNDLLVSDRTYDVIISEPSNPWITGPSKLFTREFFELASGRLNPGGILCQWVQLYGLDSDALKTLLRTYAAVFPHRLVFKGSFGDLLILGSREELRVDVREISERLARPAVAADLARVKVLDLSDLLARFRLGDSDVETFAGAPGPAAPLNTDDNAMVEFAAARTLYLEEQSNDSDLSAIPDSPLPLLTWPQGAPAGQAVSLSSSLARHLIKTGLLERASMVIEASLAIPGLAASGRAELVALRGNMLEKGGDPAGAREAWHEALRIDPAEPRATLALASKLLAAGDAPAAIAMLRRAPADPACRIELSKALLASGQPRPALDALASWEGDPFASLYRGRALLALGDAAGAVRELERYFEQGTESARPAQTSIEAATDLAQAHLALGQRDEAVAQFRLITGLADSLASWSKRRGQGAVERRDLPEAVRHFREALRWNPQDKESRRLLGSSLNELGRREEAIHAWRDLDRILDGDAEALRNIAGLSLQMNRPTEALAAFRKMKAIEADPTVILEIDQAIRELEGGS